MKMLRIGIVGQFQSGKSLLINCLLKRRVATVGVGNATTHTIVNYLFSEYEYVECFESSKNYILPIDELSGQDTNTNVKVVNVYVNNDYLKHYIITDMPGMGSVNKEDDYAALYAIRNIDFAIVVKSNYTSIGGAESSSYNDIRILKANNVPYYFVINCANKDRWSPYDDTNDIVVARNKDIIDYYSPLPYPFESGYVPVVNLMWYWFYVCKGRDELLQRPEIKNAIQEYGLQDNSLTDILDGSNFILIEKLFSMDNKAYLELKRDFKEEIEKLRDEICPIGTIQAFAFRQIPEGWLLCDGREIPVKAYPELFCKIGYTFGRNGKEIFKVPDLRGCFVRGWDVNGILDTNRKFGSYQEDSFQEHTHTFNSSVLKTDYSGSHSHETYAYWHWIGNGWGSSKKALEELKKESEYHDNTGGLSCNGSHTHQINASSNPIKEPVNTQGQKVRYGVETRPHNVALLYCIKAQGTYAPRQLLDNSIRSKSYKWSDDRNYYAGFIKLAYLFKIPAANGIDTIGSDTGLVFHQNKEGETIGEGITSGITPMVVNEPGLYYIEHIIDKHHVKVAKIKTFAVIGDFNNWMQSLDMTPDESGQIFTIKLHLPQNCAWKFRANNAWNISLGGRLDNLTQFGMENLICQEEGDYEIRIDLTSVPWKATIKTTTISVENSV